MKLTTHADSSTFVVMAVIFGSLLLSAWGAYAHPIPNPDAAYYLRAAEYFHAGNTADALSVYRWPFYSLAIAAIMTATGSSALVAAQILNTFLDSGTVAAFIMLVRTITPNGAKDQILAWSAIIVLLHPRLTLLRPVIIRDHGLYTFYLLALHQMAKDYSAPSAHSKLLMAIFILIGSLFRLEALFLGILILVFGLYAKSTSSNKRGLIIAGMLLVCLLAVPAYLIWTHITNYPRYLAGELSLSQLLLGPFHQLALRMRTTADGLAAQFLPSRNIGIVAYVGATTAITIDTTLRAITLPFAALAIIGFVLSSSFGSYARKLVLWFTAWQIPFLFLMTTIILFLDWRYAMPISLLLAIPATFAMHALSERSKFGTARDRAYFVIAILAIALSWILSIPRISNSTTLREAGFWLRSNTPTGARIITNDARIAYYSGRIYQEQIIFHPPFEIDGDLSYQYAAFIIENGKLGGPLNVRNKGQLVATIGESPQPVVQIFKLK
jgi:hypothetical protein